MISGFDHVAVLANEIEAATSAYQTLFGRAPSWRHGGEGAQRALFTLDNMTVELVAPDGAGASGDLVRNVLAAQGEGLASICFRTNDIEKMHRRLDRLTLKPEPVSDAESRDVATGAVMSWKRTRASTDMTRGVRIFFLERAKDRPLSVRTGPSSITAMDHVVIGTADPERAAALYGARLGLDMALDRTHQDWGQLMFFRCGDLIVEVVRRPVAGGDVSRDKLWGLSWRVGDIDVARARLMAAGVDVSELRSGRKPGTRVMSVRSGTCGVQTLLLERTPRAG